MISAHELRSLLSYDPDRGIFTWVTTMGARAQAGSKAGTVIGRGYLQVQIFGRKYLVHRLVWLHVTGEWPTGDVDHINGDTGDNRIVNLRLATPSENQGNSKRPANNTSGYKGVTIDKSAGKFMARIRIAGRNTHLGRFDTAEAAHAAYCAAAASTFGNFAKSG